VPVEAKVYGYMLSDGYEIGEIKTSISEINVSGPEAELLGISKALAVVEFGNEYLTSSSVVSAELKLVDNEGQVINGTYVTMNGEKYVDVSVPVYLTKTVDLTVDYKYGFYNEESIKVELKPSSVSIRGKAETVEGISSIHVATIDEKKIKANTSISEELVLPSGVICTDGTDTVNIKIEQTGMSTKSVLTSNYNIINPKGLNCQILTDYLAVLLCGPTAMLNSVTAADVVINVDLSAITTVNEAKTVPVTVTLPESVSYAVYELGSYSINVQFS
jgi:YbbR domain-containing protein